MGDVFRFKPGDRVRAGSEEAEVLDVFIDRDAYRIKILSTGRVMTIQARLLKEAALRAAPGGMLQAPSEDENA